MFPIGDENEPGRGPGLLTLALILVNVAVFLLLQLPESAGSDQPFTYGFSTIPAEITTGRDLVEPQPIVVDGERALVPQAPGPDPIYLTLLTSMFMHAGWAHLLGNMLFLWIFGDNVEHRVGRLTFLVFYLVAGVIASLAQIAASPNSVIPSLGASGAISGVLGAYLVLFPNNRVWIIVFRFVPYAVPAVVAIGLWALFQFVSGFGAIAVSDETVGGVAYLAHVGGFIAGLVFGFLARGFGGGQRLAYR